MAREMLFRGKRVDNGEWETGSLVVVRGGCSDEKIYIADKMTGYHTPLIPSTVGQYIGLTDKNGNKIFEGDIIEHYVNWLGKRVSGVVEYDHEVASWGCKFVVNEKKKSAFLADWVIGNGATIIGNIHDNPELLEV